MNIIRPRLRHFALFKFICIFALLLSMFPVMADELDTYRQWSKKASQMEEAHDDAGARIAELQAIAAIDAMAEQMHIRAAGIEAALYLELGKIDQRLGRTADAIDDYRRSLDYGAQPGHTPSVGVEKWALRFLQELYFAEKDYVKAANAAQREIDLADRSQAQAISKLEPLIALGNCYAVMGRPGDAKSSYGTAWELAEAGWGVDPAKIRDLMARHMELYRAMNMNTEADEIQRRGERLIAKAEEQRVVRVAASPVSPPATLTPPGFQTPMPPTCKPPYPRASVLAEEQGVVVLQFHVSKEGKLLGSSIKQTSGFRNLDRIAQTFLNTCPFRPATRNGEPIEGEFEVPYTFTLPK